jgi:hypothetical protein
MARKTAIHITAAELNTAEHAADERRDIAADKAEVARTLALPTLAELRAARGMLTEDELWQRCLSAARLEMRGKDYSYEDRVDCASELWRTTWLDNGQTLPRGDDERYSLTVQCGRASNYRRSLDRQRAQDAKRAKEAAEAIAASPAGLGIVRDDTLAKHAAILARYDEHTKAAAVSAVCETLALPEMTAPDEPVWLTLYQWVTAQTAAQVAADRNMGQKLAEKRIAAGAKFLRGFYSPVELASKLTLTAADYAPRTLAGATDERTVIGGSGTAHSYALDYGETVAAPMAALPLVMADDSRTAHGRTPIMAASAANWREGTDGGEHAHRAETAAEAKAACRVTTLAAEHVRPADERTEAEKQQHKADALRALGRAARGKRTGRASATSDLGRAIVAAA